VIENGEGGLSTVNYENEEDKVDNFMGQLESIKHKMIYEKGSMGQPLDC
jgi:hypothetical protein